MKYNEAGKGSTNKLKNKKAYDENYEKIWETKEKRKEDNLFYESDDDYDDRMDIIGTNGNTGDHYIK